MIPTSNYSISYRQYNDFKNRNQTIRLLKAQVCLAIITSCYKLEIRDIKPLYIQHRIELTEALIGLTKEPNHKRIRSFSLGLLDQLNSLK